MPVVPDILRSWRDPRGVIRARLAEGTREDRALVTVMGAGLLAFVSQMPFHARMAQIDPSVPLEARLGVSLFTSVFVLPLLLYVVAAVSHLVARALGGKGTGFGARMALFWAFLAVTPAMLFHGLIRGFIGPGPAATNVGLLVGIAFLYLWIRMLIEAES
jgi:hypothetical protein